MRFEDIIQRLAEKRPGFKKELQRYNTYSEVSNLITAVRIHKGLSQKELAKLVKTKQPSIARLESGKELPSVSFLDRIAKALNTFLIIRFDFMEEEKRTATHVIYSHDKIFSDEATRGIPYHLGSDSSKDQTNSAQVL
ncbi:MAG: helix-turn-helix transcriptional regulator [Candidatus Sungiibacteriota bacterium]